MHNQRLHKRKGYSRSHFFSARVFVIFFIALASVSLLGLILLLFSLPQPESGLVSNNLPPASHHRAPSPGKIPKVDGHRRAALREFPYFGSSILDTYNYKPLGRHRFMEWKDGDSPYTFTELTLRYSDELARERRSSIKKAMQHAWGGYRACAFGMDEVAPATCKGKDIANYGVSTTLVDSLDTLWLMGMKKEFNEARDWIAENLEHDANKLVSTFENTIRSLGGLLSAYDWSGDKVFLEKATDLGDRLFKAFDSPTGIPYSHVNLLTGKGANANWNPSGTSIAEAGTLQIEYRFLARATGVREYAKKSEEVFDSLHNLKTEENLYYKDVKNKGSQTLRKIANKVSSGSGKVTFGGEADSFYEYMLKIWIQGGMKEEKYRQMYDETIDAMHKVLLQQSASPAQLTYIAKRMGGKGGRLIHEFEHLECFMGGLLALGAYTDPLGRDSERSLRDMKTAKAITYTCYQMYAANPTGLGLEVAAGFDKKHVEKGGSNDKMGDFQHRRDRIAKNLSNVATFGKYYEKIKARQNRKLRQEEEHENEEGESGPDFIKGREAYYMLRPEAVESFFILNKVTGDPIYREWGWEIFQSIEKYCKHRFGYGHFPDVTNAKATAENNMESFFLGETLKYLYLLMDPDSEVDVLEKHVFNTEAHPLRRFDVLDRLN